jgi:AcrR family transcriptional regulator
MNVRDQLLTAASRLYAEVGYRGATTRRIAQAAGVNEITLFRHFGSKDGLLREAMVRAGLGRSRGGLPDEPVEPATELEAWARSHLADLYERRSLIRTCLGETREHPGLVSPSLESPAVLAAQHLAGYLERLQQHGLASADFNPRVAAGMLMGVLFGDAMGRDVVPDMFPTTPEDALRTYVRLFLRAIAQPAAMPVAAP